MKTIFSEGWGPSLGEKPKDSKGVLNMDFFTLYPVKGAGTH
jgi:hypothetical protein